MSGPDLRWRPASRDALRVEVENNLRKGRAFVPGADPLAERAPCVLVVEHPDTGAELRLPAEAVFGEASGPGKGVGLALGAIDLAALRAFAESAAPAADEPPGADSAEPTDVEVERRAKGLYEQVRGLPARERDQWARSGNLSQRVALERCFGSTVWEALLGNPQLTAPEVARIARNGTLPKPLVATIVGNGGWLAIPEVQRALLSNPRVDGLHVERVLRALSASDLKRAASQSAYRPAVRQVALRLVGKS